MTDELSDSERRRVDHELLERPGKAEDVCETTEPVLAREPVIVTTPTDDDETAAEVGVAAAYGEGETWPWLGCV